MSSNIAQFSDAETRQNEIACSLYNAECAYSDARKALERFDVEYPAAALVQMAEAQAKVLECMRFLMEACAIGRTGELQ